MALQDLTMLPLSRLGCPMSLKTPNMGNIGLYARASPVSPLADRSVPVAP